MLKCIIILHNILYNYLSTSSRFASASNKKKIQIQKQKEQGHLQSLLDLVGPDKKQPYTRHKSFLAKALPTDGRTDKRSYRVASERLKTCYPWTNGWTDTPSFRLEMVITESTKSVWYRRPSRGFELYECNIAYLSVDWRYLNALKTPPPSHSEVTMTTTPSTPSTSPSLIFRPRDLSHYMNVEMFFSIL